jgi:proline dehydrogenase
VTYARIVRRLTTSGLYRAAESRWLSTFVLGNGLLRRPARWAADQYIGGETLDEALEVIGLLHAEGLRASIDYFGEAVTDTAVIERVVSEYGRLNQGLARVEPPVNVWVDLSNLGLDISDAFCRQAVQTVVETLPQGSRLQLRAHDSNRMERILRIALALAAEGAPVMPTLAANLRRSDADLHRLIDAGVPVLLVKGASLEPARLARRWGEETDLAFLRFALELHEAGAQFAIGTHDPILREAAFAAAGDVPLEMLLGVRGEDARQEAHAGRNVRVYVPYGSDWLRYWLRRLGSARAR